jgi:murein DD-endopeptidase MepM/ murein hydrolase activator NlpD
VTFRLRNAVGAALVLWTTSAVAAKPWPAREPSVEPKPAHQLRSVSTWPAEPNAPEVIDPERFQVAYARLCSADPDGTIASIAPDVLAAAKAQAVDPFLLSALAFVRSGCDAKHKSHVGVGLLAIDASMYRVPGAPLVPVEREALSPRRLLNAAENLSVGARLLKMWQETHLESDAAFGGVAHRDAVSHFVWGDEVRSSGHEDLVLTARRRMLLAYVGTVDAPRPSKYGINIVSPLEAPPRVATSGPGDERDGGARQHRGLDLTASLGEPVRAMADGTVMFAGANVPGHPRKDGIPPSKIARYARRRLGVGGIYLCIDHDDSERKIVSCYMHLASYIVAKGDDVRAGQVIGYVGNTGVKVSPPHLHFEVRVDDRFTNPLRTLGDLAIPPKATMTHMYMLKAKRAKYRASVAAAARDRS